MKMFAKIICRQITYIIIIMRFNDFFRINNNNEDNLNTAVEFLDEDTSFFEENSQYLQPIIETPSHQYTSEGEAQKFSSDVNDLAP